MNPNFAMTKRQSVHTQFALAARLLSACPLLACASNTPPVEETVSTKQLFGSNYTQDVTQAHGHSWIMLKAIQYLNARGLLPPELDRQRARV